MLRYIFDESYSRGNIDESCFSGENDERFCVFCHDGLDSSLLLLKHDLK